MLVDELHSSRKRSVECRLMQDVDTVAPRLHERKTSTAAAVAIGMSGKCQDREARRRKRSIDDTRDDDEEFFRTLNLNPPIRTLRNRLSSKR